MGNHPQGEGGRRPREGVEKPGFRFSRRSTLLDLQVSLCYNF